LLTREAPVGEVGVLETDRPVFLGQRLMMYRPDLSRTSSEFLCEALRTRRVREQFALLAAGSLHEHLRVGDCSKLEVPLAPLGAQHAALAEIRRTSVQVLRVSERLQRQVELLSEHRQALMTAAVMGDLVVAGAT
jgi:type I restriction enzyme S subunit